MCSAVLATVNVAPFYQKDVEKDPFALASKCCGNLWKLRRHKIQHTSKFNMIVSFVTVPNRMYTWFSWTYRKEYDVLFSFQLPGNVSLLLFTSFSFSAFYNQTMFRINLHCVKWCNNLEILIGSDCNDHSPRHRCPNIGSQLVIPNTNVWLPQSNLLPLSDPFQLAWTASPIQSSRRQTFFCLLYECWLGADGFCVKYFFQIGTEILCTMSH